LTEQTSLFERTDTPIWQNRQAFLKEQTNLFDRTDMPFRQTFLTEQTQLRKQPHKQNIACGHEKSRIYFRCAGSYISHTCLYLADIADGSLECSGGGMFLIPVVSRNIDFESSFFSSCRPIAPNILRFLFVTEVCAVPLKT